jgi:hypothetical protein
LQASVGTKDYADPENAACPPHPGAAIAIAGTRSSAGSAATPLSSFRRSHPAPDFVPVEYYGSDDDRLERVACRSDRLIISDSFNSSGSVVAKGFSDVARMEQTAFDNFVCA